MNKLNAIISISSLLVGVFIGTHAQQPDNAIQDDVLTRLDFIIDCNEI